MANGDSVVSICNIAMVALGEDLVTSVFPPDNTKRAILAAQRYDDTRRAVLRSFPWPCALKKAQPAAAATAPLFGYDNRYPLPADFIRDLPLQDSDGNQIDDAYEVIGSAIETDADGPINLLYVFDLQDPTQFDPLLVHAIGYAVAAELAMPIGQSASKRNDLLKIVEGKIATARTAAGQGNSTKEWDVDVLLRARR